MKSEKIGTEIDLGKLLLVLLKKIWLIAILTGIGALCALLITLIFIRPSYTAKTLLYVNNRSNDQTQTITTGDLTAAQSLVDTYGVILKSRTTMESVKKAAGTDYSIEQLQSMVKSEPVNGTEVFAVSVTSKSPEEAASIANAISAVLPSKLMDVIKGSSVSVVDRAIVPESPSSPNVPRNVILGALVGFVVMCAIIIIRFLLDNKIHDEEYLMDTYDLPVLAAIPDLSRRSGKNKYYAENK